VNGSVRLTESLCPVCLAAVPAELFAQGDTVTLKGRCSQHGDWQTPVWVGPPSMESWCGDGYASGSDDAACGRRTGVSDAHAGACPGACGLCDRHEQRTCTALLEVTRRCDLGCPVCFAESTLDAVEPDPPLAQLKSMLGMLFAAQGPVNVQLSGGEPTLRADLADIIRATKDSGFTFVQLNTNGLRLASEPGYAKELHAAGLDSVFLQFDGVSDAVYGALRGRPLAAQKMAALERCAEAGVAVVLVPTVVPGINDHELGEVIRLATRWPGVVRGVHLQPVSYFGRFLPGDRPRLTLPEVLSLLERETAGSVRAGDFAPSCCEHALCSFRARYWVRADGALELVSSARSCCGPEPEGAAGRAIRATSRQWRKRANGPSDSRETVVQDGFDRLLAEMDKVLCISGMVFQDAWTIDLERVRRCCVHVVTAERGLVPFCLWNLTGESGARLYPRGKPV
jgi:uncharacterized radical SAM superfamily Fe-S cluster-containing enzyme